MIAPALYSSRTDDWATPAALFASIAAKFGPFDLDVCATASNAKCPTFYSAEQDGLQQVWAGNCWCNPPYGRQNGAWVRKAWESSLAGATVVCLLPVRTDTAWWQNYVIPYATSVEFLRGRIRFGNGEHSAPFPSAVVVFAPTKQSVCQRCGRPFLPARTDAKFCCRGCRQAAYRRRRVTDKAVTLPQPAEATA